MKKVLFMFALLLCLVNLLFTVAFDCLAQESILQDWLPGDGHVHSQFSSWDWSYGLGNLGIIAPTVLEQVQAGKEHDLQWIIFTDHEEMFYGI